LGLLFDFRIGLEGLGDEGLQIRRQAGIALGRRWRRQAESYGQVYGQEDCYSEKSPLVSHLPPAFIENI
jgi:hypothetical protein